MFFWRLREELVSDALLYGIGKKSHSSFKSIHQPAAGCLHPSVSVPLWEFDKYLLFCLTALGKQVQLPVDCRRDFCKALASHTQLGLHPCF